MHQTRLTIFKVLFFTFIIYSYGITVQRRTVLMKRKIMIFSATENPFIDGGANRLGNYAIHPREKERRLLGESGSRVSR